MKYSFDVKDGIKIEWMLGAQTNIAYNCLGIIMQYQLKATLLSFLIFYTNDNFNETLQLAN